VNAAVRYIVVRSQVAARDDYGAYRAELRVDFWYSCAYCTTCEAEAHGFGFHIDHYHPQVSHPQLAHTYGNLMYACKFCNEHKGDRSPPQAAVKAGVRFFKADEDVISDHFAPTSIEEIRGTTAAGEYTHDALDLNRQQLKKLRALRKRIHSALEHVAFGVRSLRRIPYDRLPTDVKAKLRLAQVEAGADERSLERALRELCHSEAIDVDPDAEARTDGRRQSLRKLEALYPGVWRGRNAPKTV
jgi:hypothetical protein